MRVTTDFGIPEIISKLNIDVCDVVAKIGIDTMGELQDTTPLDTGRARAGWDMISGPGEPPRTEHPELAAPKGRKKGSPYYSIPRMKDIKNSNRVVLFNNVEYVIFLNEGTSMQAPEMFVEKAIERVLRSIPSA